MQGKNLESNISFDKLNLKKKKNVLFTSSIF